MDDNDVDLPLEALCRYYAAVGLQFDLGPLQGEGRSDAYERKQPAGTRW